MAPTEQDVLVERLGRYPADRYPVQHATTQFHLGSVLLHAGHTGPAVRTLTAAREVFQSAGMRLEQAKAAVQLGIALRTAGRSEEAMAAFSAADADFAALDQPAEQAAAAYNLGLVQQEVGHTVVARMSWDRARALFLAAGYPARAAAAARDAGASLLAEGEASAAVPLLEEATVLADQAGDQAGFGAAANALGLAQLAVGEPAAAVSVLRRGLAGFPRTVRPAEHAMVKANLALAYERCGSLAHARLAAGQALAVPGAAPPVRAQARQLLGRLSATGPADLLTVLDDADRQQRAAVLREEMLRVVELAAEGRDGVLRGFLDGLLTRPGSGYDLAEALLQVVLELPPRPYGLLVSAIVAAAAGRPEPDSDRLRAVFGSAMARFAMPQWQRLVVSLNAAAEAAGEPATWR